MPVAVTPSASVVQCAPPSRDNSSRTAATGDPCSPSGMLRVRHGPAPVTPPPLLPLPGAPKPGARVTLPRLAASADALALVQLARPGTLLGVIAASPLDAQRLQEEIGWFAPTLRAHLLPATVVYTLWLVIGGRTLAAILGGYYGDHLAYDRARTRLRARWADWVTERG
jgi:hypothetical protein